MMQDIREVSEIVMRCVLGVADWLWVGMGLHQRSALRPFLLAVVIGRSTGEV